MTDDTPQSDKTGGSNGPAQRKPFARAIRRYVPFLIAAAVVLAAVYANLILGTVFADRGHRHLTAGEYEAALADYNRALFVAPYRLFDYPQRGIVHYELGDYEAALADYDTGLAGFNPAIPFSSCWNAACTYVHRARTYIALGRYEAALADLNEAIALDPDYALAYHERATVLAVLGDVEASFADHNRGLELNPSEAVAYFNRARAYEEIGEFEQALADLDQAIVLDGANGDLLYSRGVVYFELGDYEAAMSDLDRAVDSGSVTSEVFYYRGVVYVRLGEYEAALSELDQALDLVRPECCVVAYYDRGIAHKNMGNYEAALADFDSYLEHDPQNALTYYERAIAHKNLGDFEAALADFDSYLEHDPQNATTYRERGLVYAAQGDNEAAVREYTRALEVDPECCALFYFERGIAYLELRNYEAALADFIQAAELDRNAYMETPGNLLSSYMLEEDLLQAVIDFYQGILDDDPANAAAYYFRGIFFRKKGEYEAALQDYIRALELDPDFLAGFEISGMVSGDNGDQNQAALVFLDTYIDAHPQNASAFYYRGLANLWRGAQEDALADFSQAIRLDPENVDFFYRRGMLYHDQGDHDAAMADLEAAIELDSYNSKSYAFAEVAQRSYESGDYETAVAYYSRQITRGPVYGYIYLDRARAYRKLGNLPAALEDLDTAIEEFDIASAHWLRGLVYQQMGDYQAAMSDYKLALEGEVPEEFDLFSSPNHNLTGDEILALLATYDGVLAANPDDYEAYYVLGVAEFGRENYPAALAAFTRVIEMEP